MYGSGIVPFCLKACFVDTRLAEMMPPRKSQFQSIIKKIDVSHFHFEIIPKIIFLLEKNKFF